MEFEFEAIIFSQIYSSCKMKNTHSHCRPEITPQMKSDLLLLLKMSESTETQLQSPVWSVGRVQLAQALESASREDVKRSSGLSVGGYLVKPVGFC